MMQNPETAKWFHINLYNDLLRIAEDQKAAAEDLLQVLIKTWWGKDLSRATANAYQE